MLWEFDVGHNAVDATENLFCRKDESASDHSTEIYQIKKYQSGCKNVYDQVRSSRPKNVVFEAEIKIIETRQTCPAWRVSGELSISE